MIPWEEVDRTTLTQGGALRLMRRGPEFSIKIGVAEPRGYSNGIRRCDAGGSN
jgi:hypothetical protein